MRIAMFSWDALHGPAVGGVAVHVTELAAALSRRGHAVHVFTRPGYGAGGVWYQWYPHNLRISLMKADDVPTIYQFELFEAK